MTRTARRGWHLAFYQVSPDGTRIGGQKVVDTSDTVAAAIAQAQSTMRDVTFDFGKANVCEIKTWNGSVICEVRTDDHSNRASNAADP